MHYTYQNQLLTAYKHNLKVKDIKVLMNCGDNAAAELHKKIKETLGDKYIYPMPTDVIIEFLNIDIQRLERAAMLEKKLKKDVYPDQGN